MDVEKDGLRRRQTELVLALAEESSSAELAKLSSELEEVSRRLENGSRDGSDQEPVQESGQD